MKRLLNMLIFLAAAAAVNAYNPGEYYGDDNACYPLIANGQECGWPYSLFLWPAPDRGTTCQSGNCPDGFCRPVGFTPKLCSEGCDWSIEYCRPRTNAEPVCYKKHPDGKSCAYPVTPYTRHDSCQSGNCNNDGICQPLSPGEQAGPTCTLGEPYCGNGICDGGETAGTCPGDCDSWCGNGKCDGGETAGTCPGDCNNAISPNQVLGVSQAAAGYGNNIALAHISNSYFKGGPVYIRRQLTQFIDTFESGNFTKVDKEYIGTKSLVTCIGVALYIEAADEIGGVEQKKAVISSPQASDEEIKLTRSILWERGYWVADVLKEPNIVIGEDGVVVPVTPSTVPLVNISVSEILNRQDLENANEKYIRETASLADCGAWCGNGKCDGSETAESCPGDCDTGASAECIGISECKNYGGNTFNCTTDPCGVVDSKCYLDLDNSERSVCKTCNEIISCENYSSYACGDNLCGIDDTCYRNSSGMCTSCSENTTYEDYGYWGCEEDPCNIGYGSHWDSSDGVCRPSGGAECAHADECPSPLVCDGLILFEGEPINQGRCCPAGYHWDGGISLCAEEDNKCEYLPLSDTPSPIAQVDHSKKRDVVFIPANYQESEMDEFVSKSTEFANAILGQEPFTSNKDKLRFYYVNKTNITCNTGQSDISTCQNDNTVASECPFGDLLIRVIEHSFTEEAVLKVLINYDRAHADKSANIWIRDFTGENVIRHEFGHTWGLEDEYFLTGTVTPGNTQEFYRAFYTTGTNIFGSEGECEAKILELTGSVGGCEPKGCSDSNVCNPVTYGAKGSCIMNPCVLFPCILPDPNNFCTLCNAHVSSELNKYS